MWFDRILADVGDSQNLQASLSTFSGHIRRVSTILDSLTEHSLVLLDEVSPRQAEGKLASMLAASQCHVCDVINYLM